MLRADLARVFLAMRQNPGEPRSWGMRTTHRPKNQPFSPKNQEPLNQSFYHSLWLWHVPSN
jgi:hypothetical protein